MAECRAGTIRPYTEVVLLFHEDTQAPSAPC
ncbi:MAG: hypothetical protein ACI8RN_002868 [Glaciecola sp.]|jgi:hypothetical protein